eukprot:TRINITY_DN2092_c0_g1_i9.p1 TRINITY_DN2092_c0_g1~~TRINITY_DN2092_c0_g1_i9.p1  ORF type:complete len:465 (-),score=12.82 TRINITY_DN2092_c0_g1_i9:150-1544(-)
MGTPQPHALLLPFPAQGHINPFSQLAHILVDSFGFFITFVNTDFNHGLLSPVPSRNIRFVSFPDGLPSEHRRVQQLPELCAALLQNATSHIHRILEDSKRSKEYPPITAIISDGVLSFTMNVARSHGIPRIAFPTTSACGLSAFHYMPLLVRSGLIPMPENEAERRERMQKPVTCIPKMECLRVKDLPSFCNVTDMADFLFQYVQRETQEIGNADLIIINTWEDLEGPVLADLNQRFSGKVASIGPLLLPYGGETPINTSLWKEEISCLNWLDKQHPKSVLYVCFGSITVLTRQELEEFAWGLEASRQPFLWVIRPDLVNGDSALLPAEFVEKTIDRACFVSWAAQLKVLGHRAVGGFLTHSGWNSTLESICAGVPMISWPFFAEQQTNRRFVSAEWKVGYEMDETVQRESVKAMVLKLMNENESLDLRKNCERFRKNAQQAVFGGTSEQNLKRMVELIVRDVK